MKMTEKNVFNTPNVNLDKTYENCLEECFAHLPA